MDLKPVPKVDLAAIPFEDNTDFKSLPWYQALLADPTFTPLGNRSRHETKQATKRRTFFSGTLWTDSTIRAFQCFYKGFIPPERWSGAPRTPEAQQGPGECRIFFSLGEGVSAGPKDFAHGGLMATLLDETLGSPVYVQWTSGCATTELTVKYERAMPIPGVVLCRSWVEKMEGRKAWIQGVLEDGKGVVFARGQGVSVRFRERL